MPSSPGPEYEERVMLDFLRFARDLVADLLRPHVKLVAENALLRQRPRWNPWERYAMALATRFAPAWRTVTVLVQPATVLLGNQEPGLGGRVGRVAPRSIVDTNR